MVSAPAGPHEAAAPVQQGSHPNLGRKPQGQIEDIVGHLIDAMQAKAQRGEAVGYIADFAYPLPALLERRVTGRAAITMG